MKVGGRERWLCSSPASPGKVPTSHGWVVSGLLSKPRNFRPDPGLLSPSDDEAAVLPEARSLQSWVPPQLTATLPSGCRRWVCWQTEHKPQDPGNTTEGERRPGVGTLWGRGVPTTTQHFEGTVGEPGIRVSHLKQSHQILFPTRSSSPCFIACNPSAAQVASPCHE